MNEENKYTPEEIEQPVPGTEDSFEAPPEPEGESANLIVIVAVLVVVFVLALVGLYIWGSMLSSEPEANELRVIENNEPETVRADADVQILETVSTSDTIEAIEADIESTNLDSLENELNMIEAELDAALR